jgi:glycosyltransferase involved in cell wall biosynthesis
MSTPLRVAVCLPQVPFERGGAEILADSLVAAIRERGHQGDLVTIPFSWHPSVALLENALSWRMADLVTANGRPIDVLIATKFPSYLARHPRKVVWLFHQFRQAYDLHGTRFAQFGDDPEGAAMRETIRRMDAVALAEARALFAISGNVARRLERDNEMTATVLAPPPQGLDLAPLGDDGYLLSVGRLDAAKRIDLALRALALLPDARFVIAGDGPDRPRLEGLAAELGIATRVDFRGRVEADDLATLYGRCRAVLYAPHDEDYGFVPVEAHLAGKPVVTTTDAGGVLEVVTDGESGLVAEPSPESIARALRRLGEEPELARRLGEAGMAHTRPIGWGEIVDRLIDAALA